MGIEAMKRIIIIFILLSFATAQVTTEHLFMGAPSMSVAGSDIARSEQSWSMFVNPASLAEHKNKSVVVGSESIFGLSFFAHSMAAFQFNLPMMRNLGISIEDFSTTYQGNSLTHEIAIGLSQGLKLQADRNSTLLMGYTLKAYSVDYGQSAGPTGDGSDGRELGSHNAFGLDVGLLATLRDRIRFGAKVTNINHPQLGEANTAVYLPRRMQIGLAYSPYDLVWTTASLTRSVGHDTQMNAGLDFEILSGLHLRTGVQSNPNQFAAGFRFSWKFISVDYGLMTHPVLPLSHQFSLEIRLR
jgi:hypothetical protein|tara:strand:+ start:335 stop:1234 length:900 start_codon:yes stop_codon:yes gene_type:complete